jgi:hypothetical protein
MFTRACAVTAGPQGVIFYLYTRDVVAYEKISWLLEWKSRHYLTSYMSEGEICLTDPDGYSVWVGQAG